LDYPTPNLTYLHFEYPHCEPKKKVLPVIPNLRTLKIDVDQYFALPNVQHIRELELVIRRNRNQDISTLTTAINVQKLTLVMDELMDTVYRLPDTLPHLSSLSLGGALLPQNISTIHAPNLRSLSLQIPPVRPFGIISQFQLPFQEVEELRLIWKGMSFPTYRELRDITAELMASCISLRRIEGDRRSLSVVVKLYWERSAAGDALSGNEIVVMKSEDAEKEVSINIAEGTQGLEAGALRLGLAPPNKEWNDILLDLEKDGGRSSSWPYDSSLGQQ